MGNTTWQMTRILLLSSDGSITDELVAEVAARAAAGPVEARVLVPLDPVPDAWTWDEDATRTATLARLDSALARLEQTGARVQGTVGCDRDPMVCVNLIMSREPFDEVIVAAPRRPARLVRMDLAARIRRAFGLPVTYVTSRRPASATA